MSQSSGMPHAVHWTLDTTRSAEAIRCEVCRFCRWREPQKGIVCQSGGPFDGYQSPEGVLLEVVPNEDDKD